MNNVIEQLFHFYGLPPKKITDKELRACFIDLISNPPSSKKLTIVLDGIDEIDQNNNFLNGLLPKQTHPNNKIIISARSAGIGEAIEEDFFLKNIGLSRRHLTESMELKGLMEDSILSILEKLELSYGVEKIKASSDLAKKIEEVSEGDPFYIRFLLEDLIENKLNLNTISEQPKGVEEYLDNQFEELSENVHQEYKIHREAIIHIIVESPGPIPKNTLVTLVNSYTKRMFAEGEPEALKEIELMSWANFRIIIAPIRRFLFFAEGSYYFCHNRFKEYFNKKLNAIYSEHS